MSWTVEFANEAAKGELESLPTDMQAKFFRIANLIAGVGAPFVREPHVKSLEKGLFEMRMVGREGIARAIYVIRPVERVVVVLCFVKKTQKTPRSILDLATRRAKEVK